MDSGKQNDMSSSLISTSSSYLSMRNAETLRYYNKYVTTGERHNYKTTRNKYVLHSVQSLIIIRKKVTYDFVTNLNFAKLSKRCLCPGIGGNTMLYPWGGNVVSSG